MRRLISCLILLLLAVIAIAQDSACPALHDQAIASVSSACVEQDINSICFGHPTVSLAKLADTAAVGFSQPGDLVPSNSVDWFSTSSEDKSWGTARILFAAYPPDSLEAQTATILPFGDVALFLPPTASIPLPLLDIAVAATQGANLRAEPNTDARVIRAVRPSNAPQSDQV